MTTKRSLATIALLAALGAGTMVPAAYAADAATAVGATTALPAWKRDFVVRLTETDPRPEVVLAAWTALRNGDSGILAFMAPDGGFAKAKARHLEQAARYDTIIARVLRTTTRKSSPAVWRAADFASRGVFSDKDHFVNTGWDAAIAEDERNENREEEQVAQQAQADRDFVASLAGSDPGAWVRAAATLAGRGDAELADFFKFGWDTAARGDTEAHRVRVGDQEAAWQHRVTTLLRAAEEAETALANADAALVEKARETAVNAWREVSGLAGSAQRGWDAERARAAGQAASWRAVADFARTATTAQNWHDISEHAGTTGTSWTGEREWAEAQARQWTSLLESARAAEARVAAV
ncbi:hypothetical protein ACFQ05_34980 [Amycolatopsis umgeniensis]|uniref:Uncharacterized protein n=1 Tax=Amycolatopsis umgeniensis TaxID=336628 RepID=A0A841BA93_9PSEU|nr:hypothetical protein [Amycolatopsis umgeniensis]MBB5855840.1 hypothetical protein [Amycolatopsis umgeniensis]